MQSGTRLWGRLTNHLTLRVAARISHRRNRINFKRSKKEMARGCLRRKQPKCAAHVQGIRFSIKSHCSFFINRTVVSSIQQIDHCISGQPSIFPSPRVSRRQFTSFYVLAIFLRESTRIQLSYLGEAIYWLTKNDRSPILNIIYPSQRHSVLQRGIDTINALESQSQRRDDLSSLVHKMFRLCANTV